MIITSCEGCGVKIVSYKKKWERALCPHCIERQEKGMREERRNMNKRAKATGCVWDGLDSYL